MSELKLVGKAHVFGDNIDTDVILPGKYMALVDPKELAKHAMEGIDPEFSMRVKAGDIVIGGKNFGCGSSREHAPTALKHCMIGAIVAESFARIFYRNSINIGLPILECKDVSKYFKEGDEVEVNVNTGLIINLTTKQTLKANPLPDFILEIIMDGGIIEHLKKQISKK